MQSRVFADRRDAGRALVPELKRCKLDNPLILGLPRGGVPVAFEVAMALRAPLDVFVVRKLGAPFQPELAIGAIASGGVRVLNDDVVATLGIDEAGIDKIVAREAAELQRRERLYRGDRPYPELGAFDVVLVDDGIATGATIRAAVEGIRAMQPSSITVAAPTGSALSVEAIGKMADRIICLDTPPDFYAVGQFYIDFAQTSDDEVRGLLDKVREARAEK
ncbi:MAG: phosphoribosyltransferase [Woeseiaceae bacterium]|nr:phosphoribosyltransferase [Woeseiaceae bacterium]